MGLEILLTLNTTYSWQTFCHKNADISIIHIFMKYQIAKKCFVSKRINCQVLAKDNFVVIKF